MDAIERVYREEYEALVVAFERWARDGVPPNPAGWLTRAAANKAIAGSVGNRMARRNTWRPP